MDRDAMTVAGRHLLGEARALRAAFPDGAAMKGVTISPSADGVGFETLRAAMGYLRDEMVRVRDGKSDALSVLDDEIAHTESLLARV
jgi:hypothetical protein